MLYEWKLNGDTRNLGDALTSLLAPPEYFKDPDKLYFVIGSVICNEIIEETLRNGKHPVFIDCGWRGEPLLRHLVIQSTFIGARGPYTQKELARHGIKVEVTGDAAYKIPQLIPKAPSNNLSLAIPHIQDPEREFYFADGLGVQELIQPTVTDDEDLISKIQLISGASFVFAGAMHAAILAHAYGVPFALMSQGYINAPAKWDDWLRSVNIKDTTFHSDAESGLEWWKQHVQ